MFALDFSGMCGRGGGVNWESYGREKGNEQNDRIWTRFVFTLGASKDWIKAMN